jgi:hypothetical protein
MPMHHVITTTSGYYPDIASYLEKYFFKKKTIIFTGIFYPTGEPISPCRLRRGSFAAVYDSIISHILVAAAILTRN